MPISDPCEGNAGVPAGKGRTPGLGGIERPGEVLGRWNKLLSAPFPPCLTPFERQGLKAFICLVTYGEDTGLGGTSEVVLGSGIIAHVFFAELRLSHASFWPLLTQRAGWGLGALLSGEVM